MDPIECVDINLPESLKEILLSSNGVLETMPHPKTGETIDNESVLKADSLEFFFSQP